jgi:uncharacterized protein (TIGR03790 family)
MLSIVGRISRPGLWVFGALLVAAPALALVPDQIALVVNSSVPDSRAMADLYARQRHIPDGRIIEIHFDPVSVISPAEEMPADAYEPQVAAPVRNFLLQHNLQDRVKCLVTFWGVPLRIGRRALSPAARDEFAALTKDLVATRASIVKDVVTIEQCAAQLNPDFKPQQGEELSRLGKRLDAALKLSMEGLPGLKDPAARNARYEQITSTTDRLLGADRTTLLVAQPVVALFSPHPPTPQDVTESRSRLSEAERQLSQLQLDTSTAIEREQSRTLARDALGLFGYAFMVENQTQILNTDQSEAALDSELALLWWHNYPKARWIANRLQWRSVESLRARRFPVSPTLMVTRLDGPSLQIVSNLILTSVKVEAAGLQGQIAIDARGLPGNDPYGEYDQKLRNLAGLLSKKTKLKVTFEDTPALIAPHSLQDIGVYCGWYALRNFSSPGSFTPGAIGFHTASFECISLRRPGEHGWVRGLLSEGVIGTLGPVAEPYLQSFPPPDEFFPLLMTGKLTLAEAYWRTLPWGSWMQTCIGDPLYNPYKNNPPLAVEDLPGDLGRALNDAAVFLPATLPTQPAR